MRASRINVFGQNGLVGCRAGHMKWSAKEDKAVLLFHRAASSFERDGCQKENMFLSTGHFVKVKNVKIKRL